MKLDESGALRGRARVPGSKSQTNRAFVLAALGAGPSRITGALVADDSQRMVHGLRALGVTLTSMICAAIACVGCDDEADAADAAPSQSESGARSIETSRPARSRLRCATGEHTSRTSSRRVAVNRSTR